MVIDYVASVSAAREIAEAVKSSADAIDDAQIKLQVAELLRALDDTRIQAAENIELIASLQQQLTSNAEMKFIGDVYYKVRKNPEEEVTRCPTCYGARGIKIGPPRVSGQPSQANWLCRQCGRYYN